eukprot:7344713-Prymnesium_polylepis.1
MDSKGGAHYLPMRLTKTFFFFSFVAWILVCAAVGNGERLPAAEHVTLDFADHQECSDRIRVPRRSSS